MSAMSIILPLAVLLLAIGWGFFIGMRRTRVRFFVVLACLIIAIITTAALKSTTYADIAASVDSVVANSDSEKLHDLWDMIESSKAMQEIAVSGGAALAAPIIFTATFVGASAVSWIICYIVFIIAAAQDPCAPSCMRCCNGSSPCSCWSRPQPATFPA